MYLLQGYKIGDYSIHPNNVNTIYDMFLQDSQNNEINIQIPVKNEVHQITWKEHILPAIWEKRSSSEKDWTKFILKNFPDDISEDLLISESTLELIEPKKTKRMVTNNEEYLKLLLKNEPQNLNEDMVKAIDNVLKTQKGSSSLDGGRSERYYRTNEHNMNPGYFTPRSLSSYD